MGGMPKPRVFAGSGSQAGIYHVVSRTVDRLFRFEEPEKAVFRGMLEAIGAFHQVQVLTFCLMGNHFHLLVRVPERPAGFDLPLESVLRLWEAAVGKVSADALRRQFAVFRSNGSESAIEEWRQRALRRMFCLTGFMKALKQRFSQWYNRRTGRVGVFWEGRYRSVIVGDEDKALRAMAAYIDLNPVRAGVVEDPGDYRWSGYGEAMSGSEAAMEGLARVAGEARSSGGTVEEGETDTQRRRRQLRGLVKYRALLAARGRERRWSDGTMRRGGLNEKVAARLERESGLKRELLLRRIRGMTEGVVIGGRAAVDAWFEQHRWWFGGTSGTKRATGARAIGQGEKRLGLFSVRALQD